MVGFETVPSASEPCCSINHATGITILDFKEKKFMARQRFEPGPTAREVFVLAPVPVFI